MRPYQCNECRICLKPHDLADIFADDATTTVAEKIMYCASVQVLPDDSLPSKICKQCLVYLNVAYVFRLVCEWTDSRLQTKQCAAESTSVDDIRLNIENILSKFPQGQNQAMHPIEVLLKQENLVTSRLFNSVANENANELKPLALNALEKHKYKTNESGTYSVQYPLTLNLNKTAFCEMAHDEIVSVKKIDNVVANELEVEKLNCTDGLSVDKDDFIIEDEILLNEESLLAYGKEHFLIEDNCLIAEDNLITELHCEELNDLCEINDKQEIVDNAKIITVGTENDANFVNKHGNNTKYKILKKDTKDFVAENNLLFECNKPIYSEICLKSKDPLLLNILSRNENDSNLINSEYNEDLTTDFKAAEDNTTPAKHIDLANISLNDFETFEKELNVAEKQTNSDVAQNFNNKNAKGDRVGRHIAKKNAGQPPKRYSPTSQNSTKDKSATAKIKDLKTNEADQRETKTRLINVDSTIDQGYIFESDLSMPEPIFEETIITDSFYFTNDNEQYLGGNFEDNGTNTQPQLEQKGKNKTHNKNKTKKKQTQHISKTNQTTAQSVNNNQEIQQNSDSKTNPSGSQENSDDSNFADESLNNSNRDKTEYYVDEDDDDPNYSDFTDSSDDEFTKPQQTTPKNKPTSKNNKNRRKTSNTICKLCNKSFPFPSHLQRHLTAHIGIKRFTCKYCNKQFLHRYNLSVHMRSHTGNFPLRCNICNRGFASPSVLERHKRSHTGETPFQCQYCLQLFTHASSLSMHEKMHLNKPSFKCDICFKAFSYKSSLTAHTKGHLGFKQHSCNVCHKMFTRRTSVMRHMLCHSELKKLKC